MSLASNQEKHGSLIIKVGMPKTGMETESLLWTFTAVVST